MARKVGWTDTSITGGRGGADKERRFRGQKGMTFVIRVMTDCEEFRKHFVNDVLDADKDGEERGFNMNCSKEWDDGDDDWTGECEGCERDYDISISYIAGVLVVGQYKGRSKKVQELDAEGAVHFWDFGPDKYRMLSDIALELSRAKKPTKLHKVELTVKCEDDHYQKLNLGISQADRLTCREHLEAWKEEGPDLIAEACKAPKVSEQKRRLKKKKKGKKTRERDLDDDDEPEEKERKPRKSKGGKKKAEPEDEDEGESTGEDDLDDLLDEL